MKKLVLSFLLLLAPCSLHLLNAQHRQGKFNPEEFRERLENYVTREADFTQEEAQAFFPIYFEMKGKQRALQHRIFQLKKNPPAPDASESDFSQAIQKVKDMGAEMAGLEVTYYKKMCQAVSPRKVYMAMCAEDRFHRKMLEDFGHEGNRQEGRKPKQKR